MALDYGFILPKAKAAEILAAFNIGPDDYIDPFNGMPVTYKGVQYLIQQRDVWFPPDTSATTPDGWHIVYSPSQEEIDLQENQDAGLFDTGLPDLGEFVGLGKGLLTVVGLGIGAYALVNVLKLVKK